MQTNFFLLVLDSYVSARKNQNPDAPDITTASTLIEHIKEDGMTPNLLDLTLSFFMERFVARLK